MIEAVGLPAYEPLFRLTSDHVSLYLGVLVPLCGAAFYLRARSVQAYRRFFRIVLVLLGCVSFVALWVCASKAAATAESLIGLAAVDAAGVLKPFEYPLESIYELKRAAETARDFFIASSIVVMLMITTEFVAEAFSRDVKPNAD